MRVQPNTQRKDNASNNKFGQASRQSMQKDLNRYGKKPEKKIEVQQPPEVGAQRRIVQISEKSEYAKFSKYIVGNVVKLIRKSMFGGWVCEFVFDEDRVKLNRAAGWSNSKKEYTFDGLKFK